MEISVCILQADLVKCCSFTSERITERCAVQPLPLSTETIERWLKRLWKRRGRKATKKTQQQNPTKETQTGNTVPKVTGCVMSRHRLSSQKPRPEIFTVKQVLVPRWHHWWRVSFSACFQTAGTLLTYAFTCPQTLWFLPVEKNLKRNRSDGFGRE